MINTYEITKTFHYTLLFFEVLIIELIWGILYCVHYLFRGIPSVKRLWRQLEDSFQSVLDTIEKRYTSIRPSMLISVSSGYLRSKLLRTCVTLGGIAIGIMCIVLLISVGYGLQNLVTSRIATLDELKQYDVFTHQGSKIYITDDTVKTIRQIANVDDVLPVRTVSGQVSYQKSQFSVPAYGVSAKYLTASAVVFVSGHVFSDQATTSTNNSTLGTKEIVPETVTSGDTGTSKITIHDVELASTAVQEVVVNTKVLNMLGLTNDLAIGQTISLTFEGTVNSDTATQTRTIAANYRIVGVTSEGETPYIYVPINDLSVLQEQTYSQARVITRGQSYLPATRQQTEALGYVTTSVVDTLDQVNSIFATTRTVLAIFGAGALLVAAMGMFNTLTISLLERTKEIGLMKTLGMTSADVMRLFLTESMLMGIAGGGAGLVLGAIIGKLIDWGLSIYSLSQGGGVISVTYIPFFFAVIVLLVSLGVGVVTGIFPAQRATKISALNALRYE